MRDAKQQLWCAALAALCGSSRLLCVHCSPVSSPPCLSYRIYILAELLAAVLACSIFAVVSGWGPLFPLTAMQRFNMTSAEAVCMFLTGGQLLFISWVGVGFRCSSSQTTSFVIWVRSAGNLGRRWQPLWGVLGALSWSLVAPSSCSSAKHRHWATGWWLNQQPSLHACLLNMRNLLTCCLWPCPWFCHRSCCCWRCCCCRSTPQALPQGW